MPPGKKSFKQLIAENHPILLPVASDALTAKLIYQSGFKAYQVGGFALSAAKLAVPDIGIMQFGEEYPIVSDILGASPLPLLVDCDTGGNGPKETARIVQTYERLGISGVFFEDQAQPKKCGHMSQKSLIKADQYVAKLKAALAERKSKDFFVMARTDSYPKGVSEVRKRADLYFENGAEALFIDGLKTRKDLEKVSKNLLGDGPDRVLAASVMEGAGEEITLPWDLYEMGYKFILYPTSIIFRVAETIKNTLSYLMNQENSEGVAKLMQIEDFENVLEINKWKEIEGQN
jgi:2-methylisocitrate lyase-like PEP mutase family enzyme